MLTSIRQLLDTHHFDWENGEVIVPSSNGKNVFLDEEHDALDQIFSLDYRKDETTHPIFTAEDTHAMYFLVHSPESGSATFHRVEATYLRGQELEGISGYPYGPNLKGIDLTFGSVLEVFITIPSHVPAFVGCPQVHLYCLATELKEAMNLFTARILAGYLNSRKVEGREGYATVLGDFFDTLGVEIKEIEPVGEEEE